MPWDDESYTVSHAKKNEKSYIICYAKNIENHATFAEGFWAEFNACGRFMKYSMSTPWGLFKNQINYFREIFREWGAGGPPLSVKTIIFFKCSENVQNALKHEIKQLS